MSQLYMFLYQLKGKVDILVDNQCNIHQYMIGKLPICIACSLLGMIHNNFLPTQTHQNNQCKLMLHCIYGNEEDMFCNHSLWLGLNDCNMCLICWDFASTSTVCMDTRESHLYKYTFRKEMGMQNLRVLWSQLNITRRIFFLLFKWF